MICSFCNEYVGNGHASSLIYCCFCKEYFPEHTPSTCSFCKEYVPEHEALSCDKERCLESICWTCYDEGMMRTLCCEKTYCRLCNIGEFVECCGCGVDICPSCQVDCKMCENKLCTSCCDSTMATYCEKSGEYICNRCT